MFTTFLILPILVVSYLYFLLCKLLFTKKRSLSKKHVVIVGGSSGIGKAIAIYCAKLGANVTLVARNETALLKACTEVKKHYHPANRNHQREVSHLAVDCSDFKAAKLKLQPLDDGRPVDMVFCCAGLAICGDFCQLDAADMQTMIEGNIYATVYPLRVILPRMKSRRAGSIVIIGSQGGLVGLYGYSIYAATKFALRGLAEALHMELRDFNITVTLGLPPDTDTPGYARENLNKPKITTALSSTGGLFSPTVVARQVVNDALKGKFISYVGLSGFMLKNICIGMAPINHLYEILLEAMIMGPLRLLGGLFLYNFHRIVRKHLRESSEHNERTDESRDKDYHRLEEDKEETVYTTSELSDDDDFEEYLNLNVNERLEALSNELKRASTTKSTRRTTKYDEQ